MTSIAHTHRAIAHTHRDRRLASGRSNRRSVSGNRPIVCAQKRLPLTHQEQGSPSDRRNRTQHSPGACRQQQSDGSPVTVLLCQDQPPEHFHKGLRNVFLGALCGAAVAFHPLPALPLPLPDPNPIANISASAKGGPFPCADVSSYYSGVQGLSGPALKEKLHDVIKGHKSYSYVKVSHTTQSVSSFSSDFQGFSGPMLVERLYGIIKGHKSYSYLKAITLVAVLVECVASMAWEIRSTCRSQHALVVLFVVRLASIASGIAIVLASLTA